MDIVLFESAAVNWQTVVHDLQLNVTDGGNRLRFDVICNNHTLRNGSIAGFFEILKIAREMLVLVSQSDIGLYLRDCGAAIRSPNDISFDFGIK